jgi:hypothetical protein
MAQLQTKKDIQKTKDYKIMDMYTACSIAEGFCGGEDATDEQKQVAWQWLHDTRQAYSLQGWYGRTAQYLIQQGHIFD